MSTSGSEALRASDDDSLDEVLAALEGSRVLQTLHITNDALRAARSDSDLEETLRITHEILIALRDDDVLDTFYELPISDQANFLRWIGSTDDRQLRANRTETFVSALKLSPIKDPGSA